MAVQKIKYCDRGKYKALGKDRIPKTIQEKLPKAMTIKLKKEGQGKMVP